MYKSHFLPVVTVICSLTGYIIMVTRHLSSTRIGITYASLSVIDSGIHFKIDAFTNICT